MSASAEDGAALQQFCLLAKSAKGAACASLIGQALEHPGVFVFGELLDMPSRELIGMLGREQLDRLSCALIGVLNHEVKTCWAARSSTS